VKPELVRKLKLDQVIVHRIPAANDPTAQPRYSDVPAPPSGSVTAYFEGRVTGVMGEQGIAIEPNDEAESATRDAISAILRDPQSLAEQSRLIGERLHQSQDGRNPPGIVVVGTGKIDADPAVAVLKLEHESGVTAEERQLDTGQFMFELVVHTDLMLTERTVLFKCAVFRPADTTSRALDGVAADLQVRGVANFFLSKFLGCRLVQQPSVLTEEFLSATEAWIATVDDPEKKTRYEIQLLAHLNNNRLHDVDPRGYAQSALTAREQDDYMGFLQSRDAPRRRFPKDIEAIRGRIKRVAHEYESGIKLVAPPQAMTDHVRFEAQESGRTHTIIDDELTKTHAAG
jgi:hypothetical protein